MGTRHPAWGIALLLAVGLTHLFAVEQAQAQSLARRQRTLSRQQSTLLQQQTRSRQQSGLLQQSALLQQQNSMRIALQQTNSVLQNAMQQAAPASLTSTLNAQPNLAIFQTGLLQQQ